MIYFTSDTHWWHTNVIKYSKRPFSSVEEMNEALINNWNSVVKQNDEVWHLGDFSFKHHEIPNILRKLNGSIHLVRGNHDPESLSKLKDMGFSSVHEAHYLRVGELKIYLHHYACRVWRNSHHGAWHLFGHSHGDLPDRGRSTDVGTDCWNYTPVSLDQLAERFKDRADINHHQGD